MDSCRKPLFEELRSWEARCTGEVKSAKVNCLEWNEGRKDWSFVRMSLEFSCYSVRAPYVECSIMVPGTWYSPTKKSSSFSFLRSTGNSADALHRGSSVWYTPGCVHRNRRALRHVGIALLCWFCIWSRRKGIPWRFETRIMAWVQRRTFLQALQLLICQ